MTGLSGTYPSVSFNINGQRVMTTAGTRFEKTSCSGLQNGLPVEIKGVRQGDGSVVAKKVERDD